tara:strand:+ start:209 stop:763 length:555 start_codon:yes stop_codon:yes gene_type:complete
MENIYKNNLLVLDNLPIDESIYYTENTIYRENRYLGFIRYGNTIEKILGVINISFLHYYNILLIDNEDTLKEEIKVLLTKSIEGLENFKIYTENNNRDTKKISDLIELHKKYIDDYKNDRFAKTLENIKLIQDNINVIEDLTEINLDNDKKKDTNKYNFISNLFIGIKDSITGFFISIYSYIFV